MAANIYNGTTIPKLPIAKPDFTIALVARRAALGEANLLEILFIKPFVVWHGANLDRQIAQGDQSGHVGLARSNGD